MWFCSDARFLGTKAMEDMKEGDVEYADKIVEGKDLDDAWAMESAAPKSKAFLAELDTDTVQFAKRQMKITKKSGN